MRFRVKELSVNLPFGIGGVKIDVTDAEARAAWALYVEFSTRVATQELAPGAGSAREALSSLYALFGATRDVLRTAGPDVAKGPFALGPLAIRVLNEGLRPFMARWHSALREYEAGQADKSEQGWPARDAFDADLATMRRSLDEYVVSLAVIAGVR